MSFFLSLTNHQHPQLFLLLISIIPKTNPITITIYPPSSIDKPGGGGGGIGGGTTCPITPKGNTIKSPKKNIALLLNIFTIIHLYFLDTHFLDKSHSKKNSLKK